MGVEVDYDVTGALLSPPTDIPQAILGGTISRLKRMPYGGDTLGSFGDILVSS